MMGSNALVLVGNDLVELSRRLARAGQDVATTDLETPATLINEALGRTLVVSGAALFGQLLDAAPAELGITMVALGAEELDAASTALRNWTLR
jgi:heme oxygenase